MEITSEEHQTLLDELALEMGFTERDDDEFTIKEIAESFKIDSVNAVAFLKRKKIKYERRKAIANNRMQFVYRFIK